MAWRSAGNRKGGSGAARGHGAEDAALERVEMLDPTPAISPGDPHEGAAVKKVPVPLKVLGALNLAVGVAEVPVLVVFALAFVAQWGQGGLSQYSSATMVIFLANVGIAAVLVALFAVMGADLLRNRSRLAARRALVMIALDVASMVTYMMLAGLDATTLYQLGTLVFLVVLSSYLDPALSQERRLQRKLRDMEVRTQAEEGTIGLDATGKGYIALNFFNLFWIFVVCSIIGEVVETAYHAAVFGGYQDRSGLLFGPFSPIYGVGGVLITIALNRFYKANVAVVFLASAVIGGAFEYFVSWFLQFAFGVVAWDYTGTFLSIGGRTNGQFMCMWGVLGIAWVKVLLPRILKLINKIPWNWRYGVTVVCAVLMFADCALTLVALDSWYTRAAGERNEQVTAVEAFCDAYFDDDFMQNRFQSMTMDPSIATRT